MKKYKTHFYWWFIANTIGYSAQQICDIADVSNSLLSNWWHGRANPSVKNLIKICKAINQLTDANLDELYKTSMIALANDLDEAQQ